MKSAFTVVALIPLRGGSKSIPKKNILPINGKPLFYWVAKACLDSNIFYKVVVSTDCNDIAAHVQNYFPNVEILKRPSELATDTASTEAVMLHFSENFNFDVLCTVQATSPLLRGSDLARAWQKFQSENCDSMLSCVRWKRFFWTEDGTPMNYDPMKRPRRQDNPGVMMENGAFYFTSRKTLENFKNRIGGKTSIFEMAEETALELDEPLDWEIIELQLSKRNPILPNGRLKQLKLMVFDCDGTLTDAGMYYTSAGDAMKKFHTRDGMGMELLRNQGIKIAIMTSENSEIVSARANKLKITDCFLGIKNKLQEIKKLASDNNITLSEIGYVGDDVNDLNCLKEVGFAACPADAESNIKAACHYVSRVDGGHGAVRDIANYILDHIK